MATNDNSNQNETVRETTLEEINKKLNEELRERILRMEKKSSFGWFESVHGAIQAINTTENLFVKKLEAVSNRQTPSQPSAKEALAVYKTLSEKEWQQYFGLLDTKNLGQDLSEQLRTYVRESAEKEPYLRRLVRETIQHGKPITFSSTPEDWKELKNKNAMGDANWTARRIRLLPEEIDNSSVFHEILHIGQEDDDVRKENNSRYSRELIQKQRKFIEAEARSIDYLCLYNRNTQDTLSDSPANEGYVYGPDYFGKLIEKNENELRKNQKNIPAELTDEEKELWIHTQAVNRAIGASIHILMQPEGEKTQQTAAAYGIELTNTDIDEVNWWKKFYNNYHKEWTCKGYASQKNPYAFTNDKDREQFVHNYITNRYPDLKGKDFFVTGLTDEEQKSWDIRYRGHNYGNLTDEQIEATHLVVIDGVVPYRFSEGAQQENKWRPILRLKDIPLTEEEMNYLAKIREIQAGKRDKTDIDMPVSLKKLIETQEKTLQYNSKDKEVAAFNELVASRKELFENKNQQSRLTATINQNAQKCVSFMGHELESLTAAINAAQEHKENDNISSTAWRESGKSM